MPREQDEPTGTPPSAPAPPSAATPVAETAAVGTTAMGGSALGGTRPRGAAARPGRVRSRPPRGSDPVAWLIALVTFVAYTIISVLRELRLDPGTWDLGIFTEYIRQYSLLHAPVVPIKGHNFNLLGDHFTPIVALIAPFFRIFPSPITLLVAQALLVAVSVVPICQVARERLGTGASRAIGVAYGFSWGLQQMINFAFHELAFAVPLLAFSLAALVRRRPRAAVAWALPLVFVKEDQGVTVAAIGVIMLGAAVWARASARGRTIPAGTTPAGAPLAGTTPAGAPLADRSGAGTWARAGGLLIVWGLGWSALAIMVIIPHFNPSHHYAYWKDGGAVRPGDYFPLAGILHQFARGSSEKISTTAMLLLPVAFTALASPVVLIAVPALALRFVSVHRVFWGTGFHYNAPLMPIVFLAAVDALVRISVRAGRAGRAGPGPSAPEAGAPKLDNPELGTPELGTPEAVSPEAVSPEAGTPGPGTPELGAGAPARAPAAPARSPVVRYAAAAMVAIAAGLALEFPLSHLWNPRIYVISHHVRAEYAAMAHVPDGVTVEASETMLAPLAARDLTSWIRNRGIRDPQYVVLDTTQHNNGSHTRHTTPQTAIALIHPGAVYRQIFSSDHVYVFRRVSLVRTSATGGHGG